MLMQPTTCELVEMDEHVSPQVRAALEKSKKNQQFPPKNY